MDRLTVASLRHYVPLFHRGDEAHARLAVDSLSQVERTTLTSEAKLRELAVNCIVELARPLMVNEIASLVANSHLRTDPSLFDLLFYAGVEGLTKGLRKFDVQKLKSSSTNYILLWVTSYAQKELLRVEAPLGVAPSRFQEHKKIAAVRKRLTESLGRAVTNEELLEHFHSGAADRKGLSGPKSRAAKPSAANRRITLELLQEQQEIEKNLNFAAIDMTSDYRAEALVGVSQEPKLFSETLFGEFVQHHAFTDKALAVLQSELRMELEPKLSEVLFNLEDKEYLSLARSWRNLLRAIDGPFDHFLAGVDPANVSELSVEDARRTIARFGERVAPTRYSKLFETKR